jgi:hypothetical protein
MTTPRTPMMMDDAIAKRFCECVATCAMAQQATTAMVALTAGSVANWNFSSRVKRWWMA